MKRLLPLLLALVLALSTCLSSCDVLNFLPMERPATTTEAPDGTDDPDGTTTEAPDGTDDPDGTTTGAPDGTDDPDATTTAGAPDGTDDPDATTTTGAPDGTDDPDGTTTAGAPDGSDDPDATTTTGAPDGTDDPDGGDCADEAHADTDNNGLCDDCGTSVVIVLDLFAINDLHGKFTDTSTQIGVDEMTTYLKQMYASEDHVILLSSGDMWQGSSESNLTKGMIITEWMNHLDVVSMTLGNHEYDWGEAYIAENAELAEFPFLAINVYDVDTDQLADYCQPSVMVQRGGAKIGIIGAIGDCYSSISGEMSSGVYFKTGDELTALVKAESQKLRAEGADFIVYSLHDGHGSSSSGLILDSKLRTYYDPVLSDGYVDLVFEGHSHQRYTLVDTHGVHHLQGGGDNRGITHAEAVINFANGQSNVTVAELIDSSVYASMADDPIVDTLMEKYAEQVAEGLRVVGMNDLVRDGDELRALIAELYMQAGVEKFGSQYDIVLGGGYLSVRSPYSLAAGQVTYSQLQMLFPFDNDLVLCSIKGSDLKSRFINTTNSDYFIAYSTYGNSVKNSINDNATYYVIVDSYSSTYAPNKLTEVARYTPGVYARDLLADYIEAGGLTSGQTVIEYLPISEALSIGQALADNASTSEGYYIRATVASVVQTTYGNMYIEDADGNQLYIYGLYDSTGQVSYGAMTDPPKEGDEIVVFGRIKKYVRSGSDPIIEMESARLISKS